MPGGLTDAVRAVCLALCVALVASASVARTVEPADPEEPADGDDLERVLSWVRNPDSGVDPERIRIRALTADGARDLSPDRLPSGVAADAEAFLVDMTQKCDDPRPADAAPFTSWLFLPGNRLAAWDVQPYGPGCRPEPRLFDAADHEAMLRVGQALFRPARTGRFRYGTLVYAQWDDAFAAPTRDAVVSLLRKRALEHPGSGRAQNDLAVALYAAGERDAAIAALGRAVQLSPGWDLPHDNLAIVHRQRGDLAAAAREEELALALRPPRPGTGADPGAGALPRSGLREP